MDGSIQALTRLVTILLCLLPGLCPAEEKAKAGKKAELTLEDVIFEPTYLTKMLGPKTLLVPAADRNSLTPELQTAMAKAGVTAKSAVYLLPDGASAPGLVSAIPYSYPQKLRQGNEKGQARFLVLVGTDGKVKTLHCFEYSQRMFALAVAAALVRRQYTPAAINGTAVPVVLEVVEQFRGDGYKNKFNDGPQREPSALPVPGRDPTQSPPGG